MSFIAWIVLGLISGCTASKVFNNSGDGVFLDIELAIVGAFVGGLAFNCLPMAGVSNLKGRHRSGERP